MVTKGKAGQSLIITVASIFGVTATAGLSAMAQHQADLMIAEKEGETGEKLSTKEAVKLTWKNYILPSAGVLVTSGLICLNQHNTAELSKEVAALTASLSVVAANKNKLEKAIRDQIGDEAFDDLKKMLRADEKKDEKLATVMTPSEVRKADKLKKKRFKDVIDTGYGEDLFIEDYTGVVFRSDRQTVEMGLKRFNDILRERKAATFNDLYRCLGLPENDFGSKHIWFVTGEGSNCDSKEGVRFEITDASYSGYFDENVTYIDIPYDPPFFQPYDC